MHTKADLTVILPLLCLLTLLHAHLLTHYVSCNTVCKVYYILYIFCDEGCTILITPRDIYQSPPHQKACHCSVLLSSSCLSLHMLVLSLECFLTHYMLFSG